MAIKAGNLGRHKVISRSGLQAVLHDLKEGDYPSATSRQSIKRQRDEQVCLETPFGNLIQTKSFSLLKGKKKKAQESKVVDVPFVAPIPLLYHLCRECDEFSTMMLKVLDKCCPSQDHPLSIICYSDEVSPGNVLAHCNQRKVQVIYWSFKELGPLALSHERNWFILAIMRSEHVKRLPGKMSQFFRFAVERFFSPADLRHGAHLRFQCGARRMIFAELSMLVGDEVALKENLQFKGASGTVLCPLCKNCVDAKSMLHEHADGLVPSTSLDLGMIDFHTDASVLAVVQHLEDQSKRNLSAARFKKIQQSLGYNYCPDGFLRSDSLTLRPVSTLVWDWMHCFCVSGLWNVEAGLLVAKLSSIGISQGDLDAELHRFQWPHNLTSRGVTGMKIFSREDQSGDIKCSASECLSVYSVLRCIFLEKMRAGQLNDVRDEMESYMCLARVLDLLQNIKLGKTEPAELERAIKKHLTAFKLAYQDTRFLPKHHYTMHLGRMLAQHDTLVSCWVHERKHRERKQHANLITNTWSSWERSVLVDAMCNMLDSLKGAPDEPFDGGLCKLQEPTEAAALCLQQSLNVYEPVKLSRSAFYAPGAKIHAGDVALFSSGESNDLVVGQVEVFARVGQLDLAVVRPWEALGNNQFNRTMDSILCDLYSTVDVCVFATEDPAVVVPTSTWNTF